MNSSPLPVVPAFDPVSLSPGALDAQGAPSAVPTAQSASREIGEEEAFAQRWEIQIRLRPRHADLWAESESDRRDLAGSRLLAAAKIGAAVEVAELLKMNPLMKKDQFGSTALAVAAEASHLDCVRLLLPVSDANEVDEVGMTPLMLCVCGKKEQSLECARLLMPRTNVKKKDEEGWDALMCAATNKLSDLVEFLLPQSDLSANNDNGNTALMLAAQAWDSRSVQVLLPGSDLSQINSWKQTPLAMMMSFTTLLRQGESEIDRVDCLRALLATDLRDQVNARDADDNTPLALAAMHGYVDCLEILAPLCSRLLAEMSDQDPQNPCRVAEASKKWESLEFLANWAPREMAMDILKRVGAEKLPKFHARIEAEQLRTTIEKASVDALQGGMVVEAESSAPKGGRRL